MREVESYTRADGEEVTLSTNADRSRWEVSAFDADGEHRWTVNGTHHGGEERNGRYIGTTFVPFDEAAARAEFERWRS